MAIYSWPHLRACCRLDKEMNDGGDEKITRQGGYCYLREQMIVKKGKKKKEQIVKAEEV